MEKEKPIETVKLQSILNGGGWYHSLNDDDDVGKQFRGRFSIMTGSIACSIITIIAVTLMLFCIIGLFAVDDIYSVVIECPELHYDGIFKNEFIEGDEETIIIFDIFQDGRLIIHDYSITVMWKLEYIEKYINKTGYTTLYKGCYGREKGEYYLEQTYEVIREETWADTILAVAVFIFSVISVVTFALSVSMIFSCVIKMINNIK